MAEVLLSEELVARLSTDRGQEEFYDQGFNLSGSFGVRVSKGGRKVFFLIYQLAGRRKRMTLGIHPLLSLGQARAKAEELLREVQQGLDPAAERRRYRHAPTFRGMCDEFLQRHAQKRCKPRTLNEYRRIINREFLPVFGDRRACDIGRTDAARLISEIARGRGSQVMANRARTLLGTIFNYGVSAGFLEENPVKEVAPVGTEQPRTRALTLPELKLVWRELDRIDGAGAIALRMILLTAQRPSDVLAMRWRDLAFESWQIPKEHSRPLSEIPLSPQALQQLRRLSAGRRGDAYLFPGRGTRPLSSLARPVARLNEVLSFGWQFGAQDLRRSVEFRLRELGIRPDVVELIMNRKTALRRLRLNTARYSYETDVREALERWARTLASSAPPAGPGRGKVIPLFGR